MASLTVIHSPAEEVGKTFVLQLRPLAAGRHPSQEIQLLDLKVSRRHFLIRPVGDAHLITERSARNGVYVNGRKVHEQVLADGDQIRVGNTILIYSQQDEALQTDAIHAQRRAERQFREDGTLLLE